MRNFVLDTDSASFKEIMARGKKYKIPKFQRNYSWKEESWEELWNDILEIKTLKEPFHYMGYLILKESYKKDTYEIIDGQQRLTTISLIIIAAIELLDDLIREKNQSDDKERRQILFEFIGEKDPSSLSSSSKLFLNKNDDVFFQTYIVGFRKPTSLKTLSKSNLLIYNALKYYKNQILQVFGDNISSKELSKFIHETISKGLNFTTIVVSDEVDAYKVFETLNTRGVKLSITDLLKNAIFSILSSKKSTKDIDDAERRWDIIIEKLGKNNDFDDYLRTYWNSKYQLVRKTNLYKEVKKKLITKQLVFNLLTDLEKYADFYNACFDEKNEIWTDEQKMHIKELKLFGVKQPFSLIMSAKANLNDNVTTKVIKLCSVVSLRYSIISDLNPNKLEVCFNKASLFIKKNKNKIDFNTFFDDTLKDVYIQNQDIIDNLNKKQFKSSKEQRIARFFLWHYEHMKNGVPLDIESKKITIEHVLPQNPVDDWKVSIAEEKWDEYIYRIGNLTLLENGLNNDIENQIFNKKKIYYENSKFDITQDLMKYDTWLESDINNRSKKISEFICNKWSK